MILCWIYRQVIAHNLDANKALPERIQKHVRRCPGCRAFREFEIQITERLIANAPLHSEAPSPFLHGKILASLNRGSRRAEAERKVLRPGWSAAFVSLGLVLVSALIVQFLQPAKTSKELNPVRVAEDVSKTGGPSYAVVKIPDVGKLREWSQNLDQPLENELQSVVHDAKQALQLLAQNFLPDLN